MVEEQIKKEKINQLKLLIYQNTDKHVADECNELIDKLFIIQKDQIN